MLVFVVIVVISAYYVVKISAYNRTCYKAVTHNSYFTTMRDKGKRGEYEIYRCLKGHEKRGCRFLFNVYLPKTNCKTTELDVLMIAPECVFVFESKNYSGWIFGNDNQKSWTQVLPTGKGRGRSQKEHFYNPVWQNRTHCFVLREYLPKGAAIRSVVLFSDKCTFKNVTVEANDVVIAHRREVESVISRFLQTSQTRDIDVEQIYEKLYPYSQVSEEIKQKHVNVVSNCK